MMQTIAFHPAFFSSALLVSSRKRKLFLVSLRSSEQEKTVKKQKLFSPPVVCRRVRLCVARPRPSRGRRFRPLGVSPRAPPAPVCIPVPPLTFLVAASPRVKSNVNPFEFEDVGTTWYYFDLTWAYVYLCQTFRMDIGQLQCSMRKKYGHLVKKLGFFYGQYLTPYWIKM
ncbi:uncharacterized protein EV154DRAFT_482865 [Mucor mucedo]|uniref:uncharacterized protein n=1 Tax=Mucor mucedo TaxID=29922 RepID=UPI00222009E6|nr:uncharacterized protein EV154DRAFT_482865 [Mucor mucedo]KAI7889749.1 hypothetical protein EV154DRAFT_482865 [Mucor mucedo]